MFSGRANYVFPFNYKDSLPWKQTMQISLHLFWEIKCTCNENNQVRLDQILSIYITLVDFADLPLFLGAIPLTWPNSNSLDLSSDLYRVLHWSTNWGRHLRHGWHSWAIPGELRIMRGITMSYLAKQSFWEGAQRLDWVELGGVIWYNTLSVIKSVSNVVNQPVELSNYF